jgi:hypothetical protein
MKRVLIDENLPVACRHWFSAFAAETVEHRRWKGIDNGKLLTLAVESGFDVLLTSDRAILGQQDLRRWPSLAVVVLSTNAWPVLKTKQALILAAVDRAAPGNVEEIRLDP